MDKVSGLQELQPVPTDIIGVPKLALFCRVVGLYERTILN
jgi:hypothetical protein